MSWLEQRKHREQRIAVARRRQGPQGERYHPGFKGINRMLTRVFRLLGLYGVGRRNALDFHVHRLELVCPALPAAFDGFAVLFASDLHAPALPELMERAGKRVADLDFDLVLLGGDYQCFGEPSGVETAQVMEPLLAALRPKAPIYGVLGNHDRHDLAAALESGGIRMLINDSAVIERNGERLVLVGLDDIHAFHTEAAPAALRHAPEGFRVALIHSPEFADQAATAGMNVYLAGHTHGGQICLPGGRPVVTAAACHRALAVGSWRHRGMLGYTSSGLGTAGPTVRFNCRPEIALITLRRSP